MNIFEFPDKKPGSGLKRVSDRKGKSCSDDSQLDLFQRGRKGSNILEMPADIPPFEEALILDERGDPGAKEAYLIAINADDCKADAYCNLGIIEYEAGNTAKALDAFTRSLMAEPRHFESHFNLANLYSDLGNLPLAKTHYEFALELDPVFPDIYFNLGIIYAMLKNFEQSVKILSEYKKMVSPKERAVAQKLIDSIKKLTG